MTDHDVMASDDQVGDFKVAAKVEKYVCDKFCYECDEWLPFWCSKGGIISENILRIMSESI